MPRFNSKGQIAAGVGGMSVSIDGVIIATPAGGAEWLTEDEVIFQEGSIVKGSLRGEIDPTGAQVIVAADNYYALWSNDGQGVRNNVGYPLPDGYPYAIGGYKMAFKSSYHGAGLEVVDLTNGAWIQLSSAPVSDVQLHPEGASWLEGQSPKTWGLPVISIPGPMWWLRTVKHQGSWYALFQDVNGFLHFRSFDNQAAWIITRGNTFRPDVVSLDGEIHFCWASHEGELPADIQHTTLTAVQAKPEPTKDEPHEPHEPKDTPMSNEVNPDLYNAVFAKLEQVRSTYPEANLTREQLAAMLNEVTLPFASQGVGMQKKSGGFTAVLSDGTTIASDIIRFPGNLGADMLQDSEGLARPTRGTPDTADPDSFKPPIGRRQDDHQDDQPDEPQDQPDQPVDLETLTILVLKLGKHLGAWS